MSWYPIALIPPQYEDANGNPYSGAVLKFYAAGTSTVIALATTDTGAVTMNSVQLNANGNPAHLGAVFIPYVEEDYKIALYPSQAAADSDTGAIWSLDDVKVTSANNTGAIVDVASAATIDLNSTETNYFKITGTTSITAITLADGSEVVLRFEGALTLTNSAFIVNIGGSDITTEAGDIAVFRGEAAGVVRMLSYTRASGELFNFATFAQVVAGTADKLVSASVGQQMLGKVLLATYTPSAAASVDITSVLSSTYDTYEIELINVAIATDTNELCLRTSTNNGGAWDSSAGNYNWGSGIAPDSGGGVTNDANSSDTAIHLCNSQGNAANEDFTGSIVIRNVNSTTVQKSIIWHGEYVTAAGSICYVGGRGRRLATTDIDALQLLVLTNAGAAGGNIASGTVKVWGVRK